MHSDDFTKSNKRYFILECGIDNRKALPGPVSSKTFKESNGNSRKLVSYLKLCGLGKRKNGHDNQSKSLRLRHDKKHNGERVQRD